MSKYKLDVLLSSRPLQGNTASSAEAAATDCSYCRSPCCQLLVVLSKEEAQRFASEDHVIDGVKQKILQRRKEDGYCVYYVHGEGCSTYDDKPRVCDMYSCRTDSRITDSMKYQLFSYPEE